MPANTPNRVYPYPLGPDPIDTAGDFERLAKKIDLDVRDVDAVVDAHGVTLGQHGATIAAHTTSIGNNATAIASINSTLGTNPQATYGSVALRLTQMSTRYNGLPDQLTVQGGKHGVATDPSGNARVTFPYSGFSSIPTVVVCDASYQISIFHLTLITILGTEFVFGVSRNDGSSFPNNSLIVSWTAIGTQVRS